MKALIFMVKLLIAVNFIIAVGASVGIETMAVVWIAKMIKGGKMNENNALICRSRWWAPGGLDPRP